MDRRLDGYYRLTNKPRQDLIWLTGTSDLQRFIQVVPVGAAAPNSITVVVTWMAGLEKNAPISVSRAGRAFGAR